MEYTQRDLENEQSGEQSFKVQRNFRAPGTTWPDDPHYKRSKYNVMDEWESGEITYEPLLVISQDDPVTCAAYG